MTEAEKTWKQLKTLHDARINELLRRTFVIKDEFLKPGRTFQTVSGTQYYIAKDGSRRRVKAR